MFDIVTFAYENVPFYKEHYDSHGFHPTDFKKLDDFSKIPIIKKSDLRRFDERQRTSSLSNGIKVNTGGTTGSPLGFYLDKHAFAREWAYMHNIWSYLGYSYLDLKISFRGKSNKGKVLKYNVVHNEYVVDAYVDFSRVVAEIKKVSSREEIKYIHGYPSSIYAFCNFLRDNNIDSTELFGGSLLGVFLGSEFPVEKYRTLIESVLQVPSISWYGHSEMSVLAFEKETKYRYDIFQSYGFCESVNINEKNHLVATSFYNNVSPFIRYDTEDIIEDEVYDDEILSSFKISEGRLGESINDVYGNPISLTALIFGRHHVAFNLIEFIQVEQERNGYANIYIVSKQPISLEMLDFSNVNIIFTIKQIEEPIKTQSGKVSLLIK
ncbi:hypothetical protein AB4342_13300 [Vibrio breoganii]